MSNHVVPLDDEREHDLSLACWCQPLEDGWTIIHHAADCREKYERQGMSTGKQWAVILEDERESA